MVSIYILVDPTEEFPNDIRYLGKTCWPLQRRLSNHLTSARNRTGKRPHVLTWIKSLLDRGIQPVLVEIDRVEDEDWVCAERLYIAYLRDLAYRLTNHTDGGEGGAGFHLSEETKAKLRTANLGKKQSQETREKMSVSRQGNKYRLGIPHTEEIKAQISSKLKGRPSPMKGRALTAETRAKIAAGVAGVNKGRGHTEETRARMSAAKMGNTSARGRKLTEEQKAKLSAARTGKPGRPHTEETKAKISAAHLGKKRGPMSTEQRAKLSELRIGKPWSDAQRAAWEKRLAPDAASAP